MRDLRLAVAGAWFFAMVSVGARGAEYYVNGGITYANPGTGVLAQYEATGPSGTGRGVNHDVVAVQDFHAQANSLAEEYGLHAHAFAQVSHNVSGESGGGTYTSTAFAKSTINDVVITGPAGGPATVQAAVRFHISGKFTMISHTPAPGIGGGDQSASVNFIVQVGANSDSGFYTLGFNRGVPLAPRSGGMLVGFNGDMDVATAVFTLPVNVQIPVSLFLATSADVTVDFRESFIEASNTDFGGTLRFASDVPVFGLPAGYTVNSAEGRIVGNTFAVPEAGTVGVLAVGLVGLLRRRRG